MLNPCDYARLSEDNLFAPSGMETMDPPMQGCTIWQVVERRAPGLRGQTTNHSGLRWILEKSKG